MIFCHLLSGNFRLPSTPNNLSVSFCLQIYTLLVSYLIDSFDNTVKTKGSKGKTKQTFRPGVCKKYP